jgi:uncharacterized membrane protein YraQ (UPF0718 family)
MSTTAWIVNVLALFGLVLSLIEDRRKTVRALAAGGRAALQIVPAVGTVILAIGLLLGFVPSDAIAQFLGTKHGFAGTFLIALLGAVLYMPALAAFPLAGSLLKSGASVTSVAAFITTLTMVGTVTLPLEVKVFGKKFTFLRNGLSFGIALLIAAIMGWVLS